MSNIYTLFCSETGNVKSRMTVGNPSMIPEGELFVEGFYSTDWKYDFRLCQPVQVVKEKVIRSNERAFGDNVGMEMLPPYIAVHLWKRID